MVFILEAMALGVEKTKRVFVEYGVNRGTKTSYMGEGGN